MNYATTTSFASRTFDLMQALVLDANIGEKQKPLSIPIESTPMKQTIPMLLIWIGSCLPLVASAHDYHEFSHSVAPNVQTQILAILDKLLEKLPPPSTPKSENEKDISATLADRLLVQMDLGSATTNRLLKKEFDASPLVQTFAPIGLPLFIEELVSMIDEYHDHGKAGIATFLTPGSVSRIRAIESSLAKAKK